MEAAVVDALLADLTARISSATSTALPRDWTPPNDPLIIFAPAYPEPVGTTSYVNSSQPFRAWTVIHGRLVELTNPSDRVAAYTAAIRAAPSQAQWTLYEFGILHVAPDDVTIEVYLSVGCGFNCGHGDRVTFQRAATGHWNQTAITALWIQ